MNLSMTVIGAGSYGTALSIILSRNNNDVILWGRNPKYISILKTNRCNTIFLPNIAFPDTLRLESNLAIALQSSRNILIAVPSYAFRKILQQIKPLMRHDARVVWVTKGLETETGHLLKDVAREILGNDIPLAIISGPSFSKELAVGQPTSISIVSTNQTFSEDLKKILSHSKNFHVSINSDFIGIQISGAVKNVIAISVGIADGIGFGSNARVSLITRGLSEMSCLGIALGADSNTFTDVFCLGDLILTCTDNQSRNRYFGMMLGKGMNIQTAQNEIGQVIEGYCNAKGVRKLAHRFNVKMPIIEEIYQVLYCNKNRRAAISASLE